MTHSHKSSFSVQQLVTLLEQPNTKNYTMPREVSVDREEVKKHMRLQWKDSGTCSAEFSKAPILRPKILNEWQIERIGMSLRSYKTPKNARPYKFDKQSRNFPNVTAKLYSRKFQRYLKHIESENEDLPFKEKRTITEGMQKLALTRQSEATGHKFFRPVTTATTLFGFSSAKVEKRSNLHLKTMDV